MGQRKIKQLRVKFEGRLYKARPDRGPLNKDFTVEDLRAMAPTLKNKPVWYDHGDREDIKTTRIGKIRKAFVDEEEHLFVKGRLLKPQKMGVPLHTRVREELVTGKLPMLSMHWCAPAVDENINPDKRIAVADKRWMKEISLVPKGLYPEANIVAVAASDSVHTAWKLTSSLLTSRVLQPSSVSNTMAAPANEHAAILKYAKDVLSEEEKKKFETDVLFRLEVYQSVFNKVDEENSKYKGENDKFKLKEKRERDEYASKEVEEAEKIAQSLTPHWRTPADAEAMTKFIKTSAGDFEGKHIWGPLKTILADYPQQHASSAALKKHTESTVAKTEEKSEAVAVAASATHNAPKRTAIENAHASFRDKLLAHSKAN
jgi:hypothetical protein